MNKFLTSNSTSMKLARTVVQGIIGVLISYADTLVGFIVIPPEIKPMVVALVMAILSPVMSEIGKNTEAEG